jgi:hypothetical protein
MLKWWWLVMLDATTIGLRLTNVTGERGVQIGFDDGSSESVDFIEGGEGRLFGVTHLPSGRPSGAVVVASPIYSEFLKNNRREVLLGRALASAGIAVQRFHYRGTSNSDGDLASLTLEAMTADIDTARRHLASVSGVEAPAVVATRLGALAASPLIGSGDAAVLWEPVFDGKPYFRELMRVRMMLAMKQAGNQTVADIEAAAAERGFFDLAGFSIPLPLRDGAVDRKLDVAAGDGPVLIVQLGRSSDIRKDVAAALARFEEVGRPTTVEPIAIEEAWWLQQDVNLLRPEEGAALDTAMVDITVPWLVEKLK